MPRLVHYREDLSGRTLGGLVSVSRGARPTTPVHYRQSYFGECRLDGATVLGDFRGSDFLDCPIPGTDFSRMDPGGCRMDGSTPDAATGFPAAIPGLITEATSEILRRVLPMLPAPWRPAATAMIDAQHDTRYFDMVQVARQTRADAKGEKVVQRFIKALTPYPSVQSYVRTVLDWVNGEVCIYSNLSAEDEAIKRLSIPTRRARLVFNDSASYTIDPARLPALAHPFYRFELDRAIEVAVGPVQDRTLAHQERHVWTAAIRPWPWPFQGATADFWLDPGFLELRWL